MLSASSPSITTFLCNIEYLPECIAHCVIMRVWSICVTTYLGIIRHANICIKHIEVWSIIRKNKDRIYGK